MEEKDADKLSSSPKSANTPAETGPYVLRSLLADVPLSAEGNGEDLEITCVEFLGMRSATMRWGTSNVEGIMANTLTQNPISTLEHPPLRSYTSSKYHQIPKTQLESPRIS